MKAIPKLSKSLILVSFISFILLAGCGGKQQAKQPVKPAPALEGRITFGEPIPMKEKRNLFGPSLTLDAGGRVYIGYIVQEGSIHRVFFVRSDDGGGSFTGNIQLSEKDGLKLSGVLMGALNGSLYAVWANETDVGTKLVFRKSTDGGKTFTRETNFNGARYPRRFDIAGQALNPMVFYTEGEEGQSSLILNKGFDMNREITLQETDSFKGVKAVAYGNATYVLTLMQPPEAIGGEFILLSSIDAGQTFTPYTLFNGLMFPVYRNSFDIAVTKEDTKDRLHMVWLERDKNGVRLMYARSLEEINKWIEPEIMASVSETEQWLCEQPLLLTDGIQKVFIAYTYLNASSDETTYPLVYRLSEDGGLTFGEETIITEEVTNPGTITGAWSIKGEVHIAWDDEDHAYPGERRIFYIKGTI